MPQQFLLDSALPVSSVFFCFLAVAAATHTHSNFPPTFATRILLARPWPSTWRSEMIRALTGWNLRGALFHRFSLVTRLPQFRDHRRRSLSSRGSHNASEAAFRSAWTHHWTSPRAGLSLPSTRHRLFGLKSFCKTLLLPGVAVASQFT
jgi:hypothetical protein